MTRILDGQLTQIRDATNQLMKVGFTGERTFTILKLFF